MTKRLTRDEVLNRFRAEIEAHRPLFVASCGTGLVAKFLEKGGCDMAGVYNSVKLGAGGAGSMMGMWPVSDANGLMFEYATREILPVVHEMPIMAGVNANDPTRDIPLFLDELLRVGIIAVNNFPTVGLVDGNFRKVLEQTGITFEKRDPDAQDRQAEGHAGRRPGVQQGRDGENRSRVRPRCVHLSRGNDDRGIDRLQAP